MKKIALLFLILLVNIAQAQTYNLIPKPKELKVRSNKSVRFRDDFKAKSIIMNPQSCMADEAYQLIVSKRGITIEARSERGVLWAEQTLAQLRGADGSYPQVEIFDYPSFEIRAFMHDTGRNFIEVETIIDHLRLMSKYKLNTFHWHLTDNPAWRIESRVYPQLNDPKYQRKGRDEGRFYTYDQIRQVIDTARSYGIMVIPEIDMPGHSAFFNNTFGFSMDSPQGRKVLEVALAEFFAEIPQQDCPYFHIGSDEVHIADPVGFMQWAEDLATKYNRKAIAWDPGLPPSKGTIRQVWRESQGVSGINTIAKGSYLDSYMGYLNYYDPIVFTNRLFLHTPCGVEHGDSIALGGVLCLWNDVNVDDKSRIELHNGMSNGMLAFAERFWDGGRVADIANLNVLPDPQTPAAECLQEFERRLAYHRDNFLGDVPMRWVASSTTPWTIEIDGRRIRAWGGAVDMDAICASNGIKSGERMDAKARTRIHSALDTVITAWVGFEAAARSNRISGGIGEQGAWENEGRILVNGVSVAPPVWQEPGEYKFNFNTWHKPQEELPYTDEQFYWTRQPVKIVLRSGWNEIELSCPKTFAGQRWSFAFIPLTVQNDGRVSEVEGVSFSEVVD